MKPRGPHVLISSAGRRVALLRAFGESAAEFGGRTYACDITPLSPAMQLADHSFVVPRCTNPEFVPNVLGFCKANRVGYIVPTIDTELAVFADASEQFAVSGITVFVSSAATVAIGMDKIATNDWLSREGFPTVVQSSLNEAKGREWTFPVIAKPRSGSASIGVQRIHSQQELERLDDQDLIVQELASGHEYTVDVLVAPDGRCVCAVPRKRLEVRAGEVSKAVTTRHKKLEALARRAAERLPGAYGALNLQIFLNETSGEMRIIEINPRFGGGYPLTRAAGADFDRWLLHDAAGYRPADLVDWADNMTMLRYDDAVFVEGLVTDAH